MVLRNRSGLYRNGYAELIVRPQTSAITFPTVILDYRPRNSSESSESADLLNKVASGFHCAEQRTVDV